MTVQGVGGVRTKILGTVSITAYFPSETSKDRFAYTFDAHVLPHLKPNLLIGTDVFNPDGTVLDFRHSRLITTQGATRMFSGKTKYPKRQLVTARERTVLPPMVWTPIPIRPLKRSGHGTVLEFTPTRLGQVAQIITADTSQVLAFNIAPTPIELMKGASVGIAIEPD